VRKDLESGGRLLGANTVTLPVGTLIQTLMAREMSMMTRTITSQVLHRRVHLETFLMQVRHNVRPAVGILILLRMKNPLLPILAQSTEATGEELDNQQAAPNVEAHVLASERESSQGTAERALAASNPDANSKAVPERVMNKGKEKMEEKKEPMFIGGVELVFLDDCDVPDRKL
jgi:hypothetical protein